MVENQNMIQCFLKQLLVSNLNLTGNPPYRGTKGNFVNSYNLRNHPATTLQSSIHNYLSMFLKADIRHEEKIQSKTTYCVQPEQSGWPLWCFECILEKLAKKKVSISLQVNLQCRATIIEYTIHSLIFPSHCTVKPSLSRPQLHGLAYLD